MVVLMKLQESAKRLSRVIIAIEVTLSMLHKLVELRRSPIDYRSYNVTRKGERDMRNTLLEDSAKAFRLHTYHKNSVLGIIECGSHSDATKPLNR